MLRRILIPLDPSPYCEAAIDWSCYIADITGAHITGLAVLDLPGIERSVGSVPVGGIHYAQHLVEQKEQEALEHIEALLEKFKERCEAKGVTYSIAERQGNPSEQIIHDSIFYDLIVIGLRTHFSVGSSDKQGETISRVMGPSTTSILAVPERFKDPKKKVKVLIAFDGSITSTRALHRFAQLINTASFEITILMSHENMEHANHYLDGAEAYLKAHSFKSIRKVWTPSNILTEIRENYLEDSRMIVLGEHSKSGFTNFMLGSLCKSLIKETNRYLLIGQ